jgi:uncharacterized protein (UPF0264 family)
MTGLLVSVRSAAEARLCLDAGVDLIDIKEPSRGSLGAADVNVKQEVLDLVAGCVPVSIALGELTEFRPSNSDSRLPTTASYSPCYAKLGLASVLPMIDWQSRWLAVMQSLPAGTEPVAVAYADWKDAAAPPPAQVLAAAARASAPFLLIDTYDKSHGNLLAHMSLAELAGLTACAARDNIRLVLAGSLDMTAISAVLPLAPAYVAVRGAACAGERTQAIDAARVKRLIELVRASV